MCGINGLVRRKSVNFEIESLLKEMNDLIYHRGPDDDGVFVESNKNNAIAMGMRRLSIIDLETGKQPIISKNGDLVIVFNGEIYNYRDLRKTLQQKGAHFKTHSDTEVILKLYEHYGEASFEMLDGMFAFSIYDKQRKKLFIARDFFGEKPLYYTQCDGLFLWASELKSILKALPHRPLISKKGLNLFFRLTYVPAPFSIYDGIHKLEANHYLEYDLGQHVFEIKEIAPYQYPKKKKIDFGKAKERVRELVYKSVASRSISDVPLGTFLSGGVDSSIVSLCLGQATDKKIETFSIGFKKSSFDETDKSRLVAKHINSNHHEFVIGEEDLKDNIHEIVLNFDEPFSDTAALPTELVSRKTREHVTVALTGDGGDEVFGGYNKYYMGKLNARYTRLIPSKIHGFALKAADRFLKDTDDKRGKRFKIRKFLNAVDYDNLFYWDIISLNNTGDQLYGLFKEELIDNAIFDYHKGKLNINQPTSLTDFRLVDRVLSLEGGMLPKVDRTSMMNSLECRAPFLNRALWEFTNTLPENYLMNGWNKKYILKEAFKDQFPNGFLERGKSGFGSPVGDWLRQSLRKELEAFMDPTMLKKQGIFNINGVRQLVGDHILGKSDNTFRVWGYYCFQKWYAHNGAPGVANQTQ